MLLKPQEVADWLRIHVRTLQRWRQQGIGPPYVKIGREFRYDENELTTYIDQQTTGAPNDTSAEDIGGNA